MKTKFLSRIGTWNTPPCIRKFLTSLKTLTLLLVMLMSVNVWGETYTITFKDSGGSSDGSANKTAKADLVSDGGDFISSLTTTDKLYQAQSGYGIKIGSSKDKGTLAFSWNTTDYAVKPTKVSFSIKPSDTDKTVLLSVNGGTATEITPTGDFTDYDVEMDDNTDLTSISVAAKNASKNRFYLKSITVSYSAADPTEPSLSVSPTTIDFGTVEQNAAIPAGQDVEVAFANLTTNDVTASISGDFNINKTGSFTSGDKITVTPKSTATIGTIEGTLTVKATTDDITKTVPVTMIVAAPEVGVSFEKATSAYTDWTFTNFASQQTNSDVKAHTGAYFGTTGGKGSGSMVTKAKIAKPGTLQFFISKTTTNTTSSNWKVSVSSDNSNWTLVNTTSATGMTKGNWQEVSVDLTAYSNVYVKIEYDGSTAYRCIDDVVFIAPQSYDVTLSTNPANVGAITAKVNNVEIGAQVEEGQTVTLSAAPNDAHAYRFKEWQSDDVTITDNAFEMPGKAVAITAVFEPLYAISVTTAGEGSGTATINGSTETIYVGKNDEITLVAENATGSEFGGWSASDNDHIVFDDATAQTTTATVDAAVTITATFNKKECTILGTPQNIQVTDKTYSGAKLTWDAVKNAGYYEVYITKGAEEIESNTVEENEYTISATLSANTEYSYSVVAGSYDEDTYCASNPAEGNFTTADYPAVVLTLSENGNTTPVNGKLNTPIELPTTSTQACDGKVFMGWSENAIDGEVGKDQVSLLDATYTFDNPSVLAKTIYAVYAAVVSEGQDSYQKATSLAAGDEVIWASEDNSKPNEGVTGYNGTKDATVSTTASDWMIFTVEAGSAQGTFKFKNGTNYIAAASSSFKVTTTASDFTLNESSQAIWTSGSDKYALMKNDEYYRCYKTSNTSYTKFYVWKIVSGEKTYGNYCTTCQAAVAAPTFGLVEDNYDEPQTLTLTAAEGDIYYTINDGEETKYTAAIALNNRGTYEISAYAKVDDRTSETVTKTYTLDWAYTLTELVAEGEPTSTGRTVTVILTNEIIESLATSGNYVNGFFTMVGDKKIEVYCKNSPSEWEVGGKVSGTVTCPWKDYKGTWELCPTNWDWASYTAPAKITSLKITGDVTNKNYTAGQKLDFTGLTVTGVYSDATEEDVTADVVWTEVTLTENQPEATATATLNNVKTGNFAVSQSKSITGLTVGAAKTLVSIYVADDSEHKDVFFVGRPFSAEGLKVMAHYNMGDDQQIAVANLDITNTTFSEAKAEHTINISYTENGVEKTTSYNVEVTYMNLNDLVAEDIATNTSVKVSFSDVEITGFYTNKSNQRTGVYVNVIGKNGSNIELYSSGTPSETLNGWQAGGKLASKGDYITGTWKYYDGGSVWEIDFGSNYAWSTNIEYTAPVIYPTAVALSETTATVKQSKTLDLTANFTPDNATVLNNLEWSSDNTQVTVVPSQDKKSAKVTVASDATVGTATITVKVDDKDGNELSATCVITIEEYSVPHYGLCAGDITEGNYIFKADGKNYFMNNTNNNGRLANVANENNPEIVNNIITTDAESFVWQIAKSGDYWTIQNLENSKYVSSTTKSSAGLVDDATANTALWTITYDATNEVYTFVNLGRSQATSDADKCYLRNNNNSGWACYANGTGNAITLYKAGFTPAPALSSLEITGELNQTEYFQGKSVKYDGLSVLGHYSDGSEAAITDGITWSADPATFTVLGAQTVTITATVQTKTGEVSGNADFNVTVVESHQINYGLVTSVNTLYDGAVVVLGAVYEKDDEPIYAVNQGFYTSNYKYLLAYRSNIENSDLEYENEVMKTANASEITLKKVENGWLLIDENNNYICGAADLSKTTKVEDATIWTISIADGKAVIAAGDYQFFYNKNSGAERFKTYANTTTTQEPVGIYMKNLVAVRTGLTAGKIATYCEAKGASVYDGATFFDILNKDAEVKNVTLQETDEQLFAGMPYIIEPSHNILKVVFEGDAVTDALNNNGLYGWLDETLEFNYQIDSKDAYFVSGGRIVRCGENCTLLKNRAYVVLDYIEYEGVISPIPGRRCIRLATEGSAVATGCEDALYISNDNELKKVVVDGQFFIIRNGKVFDAQGKLVK